MKMAKKNHFSQVVNVFQGRLLPEPAYLGGYSALIASYSLEVPLPTKLCAISEKHVKYQTDQWVMLTARHNPHDTLLGHLTLALKYEGVELGILKALFEHVDPNEIIEIVKSQPTSQYGRRIWFLYEWLQEKQLDLADAKGPYVEIVNSELQYPGPTRLSPRHRIRNNLPGVHNFCPMIRRTALLDQFIAMKLEQQVQTIIGTVHPDLLVRAASFLLLKDSKASYAIEGETPPQNRAERWGAAIGQAGQLPLSDEELYRLQELIISDFRFTHYGYRVEGGFIGEHERASGQPIPDHISACPEDLPLLMSGLIDTDQLLKSSQFDPVLAAAIIAFGFVFIHPFEDGNGRLHRYLIHHVLSEKKFTPQGIIFPVSYVLLERITQYRQTLESYSKPRLKFIKWKPTVNGNVEVLNKTIDLYRYFDATQQAEFLYQCIQETVEKTLPEEIIFLRKYDEMKNFIINTIEIPDRLANLLIQFLIQGQGKLSKRALSKEFSALKSFEVVALEEKFNEVFL